MTKINLIKGARRSTRLSYILTEDFRRTAEEKLGKLDAAKSFMYLFRRFGRPHYDNAHDYKILYYYCFTYGDLNISIHAGANVVWFGLGVKEKFLRPFWGRRKAFEIDLAKKSINRHIPFILFTGGFSNIKLPVYLEEKNWQLITYQAKKYFNDRDFNMLKAEFEAGKLSDYGNKIFDELWDVMCKRFRASLTRPELKELNKWEPELVDVSDIRRQALGFFRELKKGVFVRDVYFDIRGIQ